MGSLIISMPFDGDQALFTVMARECNKGQILYRDQWDIINPGLLLWYRLAGTTCGFHEIGIHTFEVAYWIIFIACLTWHTKSIWPTFLVAGVYFATSSGIPNHLGKTEGLVAFPMTMAILGCLRASQSIDRKNVTLWGFLAGACAGIVILFKLLFIAILVPVALWILWTAYRSHSFRHALLLAICQIFGVAIVLSIAAIYFVSIGSFTELMRTLFKIPPLFIAEGSHADGERMRASLTWFTMNFAGLGLLAIVLAVKRYRESRDPAIIAFAIYFLMAAIVIAIQRTSWWSYHFLLLGLPLGVVISHCGLPKLSCRQTFLMLGVIVILLIKPIGTAFNTIRQIATHRTIDSIHRHLSRDHRDIELDVVWLRDRPDGPIVVLGHPLIFLATDRSPATAIHGWSMELYPQIIRDEFTTQIVMAKPKLIYVDRTRLGIDQLITEKYPALQLLLQRDYRIVRTTELGDWYESRTQ